MKILIVEDDADSRVYLERALLSQGYSVESADNGVNALKKAELAPPDLIISSTMVPEMDGFELCRRVKKHKRLRTIPFVFYTTTATRQKDEPLAMALGASGFLVKPMEPEDFFRSVREIMEQHSMQGLPVPDHLPADMALDRMQVEALARQLDKKVRELEEQREACASSERKYRKLLESMMDAFVYVDMDGAIRDFNETYRLMLGYDREELKRLTYSAITPETWHNFEQKIVQEQVQTRGYSDIYEKEYRKKDGTIFPVELHAFLIKNEQGENEGMWAIVRDLTERKQADNARRESEERFRSLFNNSIDAIILAAPDGRIYDANPAACRIFGLSEDEFRRLGRAGIVDASDDGVTAALEKRDSSGIYRGEITFVRKDGTKFPGIFLQRSILILMAFKKQALSSAM